MYNDDYNGSGDPYQPPNEPPPQAPGGSDPGPVEFIGFDPEGRPVYRGADGTLYTDDVNGVNGLGAYTGPGVSAPPNTPEPPTPTPPPSGTGDGTVPPLAPFAPPTPLPLPPTPEFHPPTFTPPPAFVDPSMADVENDPGYRFAADEGQRALEHSKAAGGTLNTGGTLKDLIAWGGNFAQQRYGDVRNRQKDTYMANYQTQYIDPYHLAYTSALDQFNPQMTGYETETAWNQHANDMNWQHEFDLWNAQYNRARDFYNY